MSDPSVSGKNTESKPANRFHHVFICNSSSLSYNFCLPSGGYEFDFFNPPFSMTKLAI